MRPFALVAFALTATSVQSLLAHGPQIQITGDAGKIVTRAIFSDGPYSPLTPPKSVYVIPMKQHVGVWYTRPNGMINPVTMLPSFYSGPGIAYGYGYDPSNPTDVDFAVGSVISLAFTDGLKLWDGASFVDAGPAELEAFRGVVRHPDHGCPHQRCRALCEHRLRSGGLRCRWNGSTSDLKVPPARRRRRARQRQPRRRIPRNAAAGTRAARTCAGHLCRAGHA